MPLQRPRILCSDYNHDDDPVISVLRNFIFTYYIMVKRETPTECYKTYSKYLYLPNLSFVVCRTSRIGPTLRFNTLFILMRFD